MPTKANVLAALRWLALGANPGDEMFLHYSGQGGTSSKGEFNHSNDILVPCDYVVSGRITDEELYGTLVADLPRGCRLWIVMDCCDGGTALDLRFKVQLTPDGKRATFTMSRESTAA